MTESEARRAELVQQTRRYYREQGNLPIIHPRYGTYFPGKEKRGSGNTFFLRLTVSVVCFLCYMWMSHDQIQMGNVTTDTIVEQIEAPMDFTNMRDWWEKIL